jgi:ribulose-phosphate 3-epimerase
MTLICPSLLAADFSNLGNDIEKIESSADALHLDIMDGSFVPNISFGLPVIKDIRKISKLPFDVHLMIDNPSKYVEEFAKAGADWITVHAEACKHLNRTIHKIKELGCKAGVSLNPHTSEDVLKYIIKDLDLVLVMSVNPGFGGQSFIEESIEKIKNIKAMADKHNKSLIIAVDGGVNNKTIRRVVDAGANLCVAGSAVFKAENPAEAIEELRNLCK